VTFDPSGVSASTPGDVRMEVLGVDHPDSAGLLRAFREEQLKRYGYADPIAVPREDYAPPLGTFVVMYDHERPVGCGGCRWYDQQAGTAEIKKTYLLPIARGRGWGRLLMRCLEEQAVGWGAGQLILETGVRNTAAIDLFTRCGYSPIGGYVEGRDPVINRAFAKRLTRTFT
jgi:GNAT superfamily N-acetyltransferase